MRSCCLICRANRLKLTRSYLIYGMILPQLLPLLR